MRHRPAHRLVALLVEHHHVPGPQPALVAQRRQHGRGGLGDVAQQADLVGPDAEELTRDGSRLRLEPGALDPEEPHRVRLRAGMHPPLVLRDDARHRAERAVVQVGDGRVEAERVTHPGSLPGGLTAYVRQTGSAGDSGERGPATGSPSGRAAGPAGQALSARRPGLRAGTTPVLRYVAIASSTQATPDSDAACVVPPTPRSGSSSGTGRAPPGCPGTAWRRPSSRR